MTHCEGCGAAVDGILCQACGRATKLVGDAHAERRALEELHGAVGKAAEEAAGRLLANGFLPASKAVLIEAGLRCVALAGEASPYHIKAGALSRLEAVTAKLRLMPADGEGTKALETFDGMLQEARAVGRRDVAMFVGVVLLLLLLAVGVASLFLVR